MKKEFIIEFFEKFENAGFSISDYFADIGKMIVILGDGAEKK